MSDKKYCAGTYKVSGYTKSDGTKVSSYMRTCGAKHEGDNSPSQRHQSRSTGMNGGAVSIYELTDAEKESIRMKEYNNQIQNGYDYIYSLAPLQRYVELHSSNDDLYHKYYRLSLDYENQKQYNKENSYIKFKDIQNTDVKSFIKNNLEMLDIPAVYDYTDVVIPQQNSKLVKTVYNFPEFKNVIKSNLSGIKSGKFKNKSFNITFDTTQDAHLILGHATLYNMRVVDDYVCGTLIDYYNFKHLKYYSGNSLLTVTANNNAYRQQQYGKLTNYLMIFPVRIPIDSI